MAATFNVTVGPGWKKTIVTGGSKRRGMISMAFNVKSVEKVLVRAARKGGDSVRLVIGEMTFELELVLSDSQKIVPVDTSALKQTGIVIPASADFKKGPILSYGRRGIINRKTGKEVDYAADVHDDVEKFHPPPGEAKFVEKPLKKRKVGLTKRLAIAGEF